MNSWVIWAVQSLLTIFASASVHASPVQVIECRVVTYDGPVPAELVDANYVIRRHVEQVPPFETLETDYWAQAKFEDNGYFDVTIFTLGGEGVTDRSTSTMSTVMDGYSPLSDEFDDQATGMEQAVDIAGWKVDSAAIHLEKGDGSQIGTHLEVPDELVRADWDEFQLPCGVGGPCMPECTLTFLVPGGGVECEGPQQSQAICTHGTYIGRIISISYEAHDAEHGAPFEINAGLNDAWVSDGAPFQGLFVTVFPELGLVFVAWFTFDTALPEENAAVFGSGGQRWVTAVGPYEGNAASLKAELTTGGAFDSAEPMPQQDTDYGTVDLQFENCGQGKVSYEFPPVGLSGSFVIRRAIDDNSLCEALSSG